MSDYSVYPADTLRNDTICQQYLQWSQALDRQNAAYAADTANTSTAIGNIVTGAKPTPTFKAGAHGNQQESHTLGNIFLFTSAAATIIGGVAMHKAGGIRNAFKNGEVISSTKKGLNMIWHSITGKNVLNNKFTVNIKGNNVYYTGLGKTQVLEGSTMTDDALQAIGLDKNFSATEVKLENILNGRFKINSQYVTVKDGKIVSYTDRNGKTITDGIDTLKDTLTNFLKNINGKSSVKIESAEVKDVATEGVERIFSRSGNKWNLTKVTTDRFSKDSDAIRAILNDNPTGALAKQINAGSEQQKLIDAGMKPNIIEREITIDGKPYKVQFTGNKVSGIYDGDTLRGVDHVFYKAKIGTDQKATLASWSELIKGNQLNDFTVLTWC